MPSMQTPLVCDYPLKDRDPDSVDTSFAFKMERSACALFGVVLHNSGADTDINPHRIQYLSSVHFVCYTPH
jgi:hypothetical protein